MRISACVIAKNEEQNIKKCILSYKDIANEIIVVDTGSTDSTAEVARSLGAKVHRYEWENDFAKAKNYALNRAKGDWIIFLDADEFFAEGHARNVKEHIRRIHHQRQFDGICCRMANIQKDSNELISTIVQVRIFRNHPSIRYENSIHEAIYKGGKRLNVVFVEKEDILIYHTGYSASIREEKAQRNLEILHECEKKGPYPGAFNGYISDSYFVLRDWDKAILYAQKYIDSGQSMLGYDIKPHINIVESMIKRGDESSSIVSKAREFIDKFPDNPTFYMYLAEVLFGQKNYSQAYKFYKKAVDLDLKYNGLEINAVQTVIYNLNFKMGVIHYLANKYEEAFKYFTECLKKKKYYFAAFSYLFRLIRKNTLEEQIALFNSIYDMEIKEDVSFLTKTLSVLKGGQLLIYYEGIWIKKFNESDITIAYTLYSSGMYKEAFQKFFSAHRALSNENNDLKIISIASCILSDDKDNFDSNREFFTEEEYALLDLFFNEPDISKELLPRDLDKFYVNVLNQIINVAPDDILNRYINLAAYFGKSIWLDIIKCMYENLMYASALDLCCYLLDMTDEGSGSILEEAEGIQGEAEGIREETGSIQHARGEILFWIGLCYFKLEQYREAGEFFELAAMAGYKGEDLKDFASWCGEYIRSGRLELRE